MQALIDSGKYKVMEVLYSDPGYEVCLCTDVMVNSGEMLIVNTYKSRDTIHDFLPLFFDMKKKSPRDFKELITSDGRVSAIFRYHAGQRLSSYFVKGKNVDYPDRLKMADSLLTSALELDLLDDRIVCRLFTEENTAVDEVQQSVGFNFRISPNAEYENGFRSKRLGEMLRRIFPQDRYLPEEIESFITDLCAEKYPGYVAAYSHWREIQESAAETRILYEKETLMQYLKRKAKAKRKKRSGK